MRLGELFLVFLKFAVGSDRVLEGRDEEIEDLLALGVDVEFLAEERQLHAERQALRAADTQILRDAADAIDQVVGLVRLAQETVGAAFEAVDHLHRIVEARDQNDRHGARALLGLDAAAELVARHAGHHDVGDHDLELARAEELERPLGIGRHRRLETCAFQRGRQPRSLGRAVFSNENLRHWPLPESKNHAQSRQSEVVASSLVSPISGG